MRGLLAFVSRGVGRARATLPAPVRLPVFFALLSAAAGAQPIGALQEGQWVHTRVFATVGVIGRQSEQVFPEGTTLIRGAQVPRPLSVHVSGAHFARPWLGVGYELRSELLAARELAGAALQGPVVPQQTIKAGAHLAFRWQQSLLLGLEGHLGWSLGSLGVIRPLAFPSAEFFAITGPVVGAAVTLDPTTRFTAQVYGRVELSLAALVGPAVTVGVQARYALVDVGPFELGLAFLAELTSGLWAAPTVTSLNDGVWRLGLGPSLVGRRAPAPREVVEPTAAPSLTGRVTRSDGRAVPGAVVSAGGQTATSDAAGAFALFGLPPGPSTVTASTATLRPASVEVVVTPGTPVELTMVLAEKTGPGRITGVVSAGPDRPLAGAKVTSGATSVKTNATGEYVLEKVGPGPVKVRVLLDGYTPADEVVQVPPEASAKLDVTLEVATQRAKAKVRGLVSSVEGPVAKASVRIVELKLKQAVKADGRFEVEVPGGRYTLVIEAPRHVTQTRQLEVADGDQAIFQIELEKTR